MDGLIIRYDGELVHWQKWQPEVLSQQLVEAKLLYPFMYGVNIQGFKNQQWPVMKVDGIEMKITGSKYREGDALCELFLPSGVEFTDLTLGIVTMKGDDRIERWFDAIARVIMTEFNYTSIPRGFQPDEIEYLDKFMRDIVVHFLDFNGIPMRSLLLKKTMPISHSISSLDSLSSSILLSNVTFNVTRSIHGI